MRGSIVVTLIFNLLFVISLVTFLTVRKIRQWSPPERLNQANHSKWLSLTLKHWWFWQTEPFVQWLVRHCVTPNTVTLLGFFFSAASAWLFAKGWFGYAGWMLLFGSTFDMFDGWVARLTGRITQSGAFFDSVVDRFSEGILFIGIAYFFRDHWTILLLVLAGLIGSMMVSYTRARGEGVGIEVKMGAMQRPERVVYLGCGAIFEPFVTFFVSQYNYNPPPYLFIAALSLIAVMTLYTAFSRMLYVMRLLDQKG